MRAGKTSFGKCRRPRSFFDRFAEDHVANINTANSTLAVTFSTLYIVVSSPEGPTNLSIIVLALRHPPGVGHHCDKLKFLRT
jgi:hypothetical protein